jgi:hypothetical protein
MAFKDLKKRKGNALDKMKKAAEQLNESSNNSGKDDRIWKLQRDASDNGFAIIRFLPAKEGAELPWVRYWDHGFKGPSGQWYIEKSLTSIGQTDPVGEYNSKLWNTGRDEDKAQAREQKRRLHYVANVYIVSDPANPDNEGKVMLYQFGKKIFDKIMDAISPSEAEMAIDPDLKEVDVFDFWEGANFKIKARRVDGWVNYDKSEFAAPSALLGGDDEELEKIYDQMYDLSEFTDPANYKSYDELKNRLDLVLGVGSQKMASEETSEPRKQREEAPRELASAETDMLDLDEDTSSENGDDVMDYFAKLADED